MAGIPKPIRTRFYVNTDDFSSAVKPDMHSQMDCLRWNETGRRPLTSNTGVETTLRQFQELERKATPQVRANWRFQQALYRANYDAFVRERLITEIEQEHRALGALEDAPTGRSH